MPKGTTQRIPNSILDYLPGYTEQTDQMINAPNFGGRERARQFGLEAIKGLMALRPSASTLNPTTITGGKYLPNDAHSLFVNNPVRPASNPTGSFSELYPNSGIGHIPTQFRVGAPDSFTSGNRHVRHLGNAANENAALLNHLRLVDPPTKGGNSPRITTSEISSWMNQARIPNRTQQNGQFGTEYVAVSERRPHSDTPLPTVHVRVPNDGHVGRPANSPREAHNRFDTGTEPAYTAGYTPDPRITQNRSGGSYSEPQNLFDALRWRFSRSPDGQFLIPESQAPMGRYPMEPMPQRIKPSPDQLKLLGTAGTAALGSEDILRYLQNGP